MIRKKILCTFVLSLTWMNVQWVQNAYAAARKSASKGLSQSEISQSDQNIRDHGLKSMSEQRESIVGFVPQSKSNFIFSPEDLNQIGKLAVSQVDEELSHIETSVQLELARTFFDHHGVNDAETLSAYRTEIILERTISLLQERYPGHISRNPVWVWNNVGGVFARMTVLYCSFNEYIAVFGSPLVQSGFSGEYTFMDVYDVMIQGRMVSHDNYPTGALPLTYQAGDVSLLKGGSTRYYSMDRNTYMIDYGRGSISRALWQGVIAPVLYTSHDYRSMKDQLKSCGSSILNVIQQKLRRS